MATARGTSPVAGSDTASLKVKEESLLEKVNENGLTDEEQAELDEIEETRKEDKKVSKQALTRLSNAVEAAREKGWTVACRIDRVDFDGTSEGHTL